MQLTTEQIKKERKKEYDQKYKAKTKEKNKEYDKNWRRKNQLRTYYHSNLYKISGYTFKEFETHLLNLGWEPNFHIDHKIPITYFSPNTPIRLIHDLRNLHPVNSKNNLIKGNRYQNLVDEEYYQEVKKYLII
jgi:hypothetical protein